MAAHEKKKIISWGNSAGLILTQKILSEAKLNIGDSVSVYVVGEKIIIEPARRTLDIPRYTLEELLEGAEPEEEISTGAARGAEILEPYEFPNPLDGE